MAYQKRRSNNGGQEGDGKAGKTILHMTMVAEIL
jgi:hypothetical protein